MTRMDFIAAFNAARRLGGKALLNVLGEASGDRDADLIYEKCLQAAGGDKDKDDLWLTLAWLAKSDLIALEQIAAVFVSQAHVPDKATAGDHGTATAGYKGTATVGDGGTATAGFQGKATAGDFGMATAGNYGKATAGYNGKATAGHYGKATVGNRGTATVGNRGTATAGKWGILRISYGEKRALGYVGEHAQGLPNGQVIQPDTPYQVDVNGNWSVSDP